MAVVRRCLGALAVVFAASFSGACATSGTTDETDIDAAATSDAPSGGPSPSGNDGGARVDTGAPSGSDSATTDTGANDHDSAASDGAVGGDASGGVPAGQTCQKDGDCASGLCKPVLLGQSVCVIPCTQASDCTSVAQSFCEPVTPSATNGYCIPRSPSHCLSCQNDSDCGSLGESCMQGPSDNTKACHIDCSLDPGACPADYTCAIASVNGTTRHLCMPNIGTCLDSVGGYCDRIGTPQACTRSNGAGTCNGQRQCLSLSNRFDKCDALAPQCKATCASQDPAGCKTSYCPAATTVPDNCVTCGNVCPGLHQAYDNVTCSAGCTFSCQGENYDVDGIATDGCEIADTTVGNHSQGSAVYIGSFPCSDPASAQNIQGKLPSDTRVHENAAIVSFDAASGSAPDYIHLYASGGANCQNDVNLDLQITGSSHPNCYSMKLANLNANANNSCGTDTGGHCSITNSYGSYADGTDIFITIAKTCSSAQPDNASYTVTGHL
jgi:hypothetical protein